MTLAFGYVRASTLDEVKQGSNDVSNAISSIVKTGLMRGIFHIFLDVFHCSWPHHLGQEVYRIFSKLQQIMFTINILLSR